MTEETARLDYSREPPGYSVGAGGDFQHEGYVWWGENGSDSGFTALESALTAAWSSYKKHHDPPGCEGSEARAKAWAWYDAQAPQRALTAGEQLVWAAAFSAALARGLSCPLSVRLAMSAVYTLREAVIDGDSELDRDQRAAVEQMRGGQ